MSPKERVSKDRQLLEEQTRKALQGLAVLNPRVQDEIIEKTIGTVEKEENLISKEDKLLMNVSPSTPILKKVIPQSQPDQAKPNTVKENNQNLGSLVEIPLKEIILSPYQPRVFFDEESLSGLMESIEQEGLHQPILVRQIPTGGYELITGERRFRSFQKLGRELIPAIIRTKSDEEAMVTAFSENLQRENFTPYEEAKGYARLTKELNLSQTQLAKRLGISHRRIGHLINILELPEPVLEQLFSPETEVTVGHAEALLPISKDSKRLEKVAEKLLTKKLTVKQVRAEVSGERRTHSSFQPIRYNFLGRTLEKGYTLLVQFRPDRPFDHGAITSALSHFQDYVAGKITREELLRKVPGCSNSSPDSDIKTPPSSLHGVK